MHGIAADTSDLIQTARMLTCHLAQPRPARYWFDFLLTHALGCVAFYFSVAPVFWRPLRWVSFVVCVLLWYRSIAFIHELVHFRSKRMRAFSRAWNLLAGIPFLCPSFLYSTHLQHHSIIHYGTADDGEYSPWGVQHPRHIFVFALLSFGAPLLAALRFGILAPLSAMIPSVRVWVQQRASALVVNASYRRTVPDGGDLREWRIQEAGVFLWVNILLWTAISGRLSWRWPVFLVAALGSVSFLNSMRTLAAHRFRNMGGSMSFVEQILDSVNHPEGGLFMELLCPVGLRFHSLHHMLPSLPYHSLPEAHRILMRELPPDSFYRQTNSPGILWTIRYLVSYARRASALKMSAS